MQKYADYVTSQATWLGRLPTHWDCKKIGALFSERKVKVSDKDYAPLLLQKLVLFRNLRLRSKQMLAISRLCRRFPDLTAAARKSMTLLSWTLQTSRR